MIPSAIVQVLVNLIDFKMQLQQAIEMPRFHHQWMPDRVSIEGEGVHADVIAKLRALGHDVTQSTRQGDAHSIWVAPDGTPHGAADKRTQDSRASVPKPVAPKRD